MDKTKQKAKDKCQYQQAKVQNSRVHGLLVSVLMNGLDARSTATNQPKSKVGVPRKTIIK